MAAIKLFGLVVDDEQIIREALADALKTIPRVHGIVQAENGSEALIRMQNQKFHFALIDLSMPRIGGIELLKRIRNDEKQKCLPQLPVIIVSGNVQSNAVQSALTLGVKDILVKPFQLDAVKEKVTKILTKLYP